MSNRATLRHVVLRDLCVLRNGRAYKQDELLEFGKYKVLRVGNFFSSRSWYYSDLELEETKYCSPGDLLYAWSASFGPRIWDGEKAIFHYHIWRVDHDPNKVDKRFLYHWLTWDAARLKSEHGTGATMIHVTKTAMENRTIPLPPLAEQKRIADILDKADAIRRKRQQAIEQLDTLVQSTFLDMFGDPVTNPMGWNVGTLPDGATVFADGPFGSNLKSSHYTAVGIRVIRLQNVGIGELLDDDLAYISEKHFDSLPRNHCKPGDVIVGTLGDPNLRACVIPPTLPRSLNKADCILLRPNGRLLHAVYACWLLNTPSLVIKALELVRGQTRGRISMGRLKTLLVPLPPLDLQTRFASIVKTIEQQKTRLKAHVAELDTLFASLQSRAFAGEL